MSRSPQPNSNLPGSPAPSPAEPSVAALSDAVAFSTPNTSSADDIAPFSLDRGFEDALHQLTNERDHDRHRIQELLGSLGFALRAFDNLDRVLDLIPLVASRLTDADGSALVLLDADGTMRVGKVYCAETAECALVKSSLETATRSLPVPSSLPVSVSNSTQLTKSISLDPKVAEEVAASSLKQLDARFFQSLGEGVRAFGTPILMRQTERGRLYVFSHQSNFAWTTARQKSVRLVADQAAVAIERADLKAELERRVQLAKEVEIGSEIQSRLQPSQCPHIPGTDLAASSRSASQVGGDYYDFIAMPADADSANDTNLDCSRWGIAIGDVMGKGVPAGLLMMATRGALRSEVLNGRNPAQILGHLNRVMLSDMENSSRFVSLFYSDYCPQTRQLCFGNAAHNPPLWHCAQTGQVLPLDTLGMLIGLTADSQYEAKCVQLEPGDLVVYYTDGITEATNASGDRFEAEGLIAALERIAPQHNDAESILNELFASVAAFQGRSGRQFHCDDMTLVVMKILPV
ncbi:MAG: GAF domain-containing SpoIIE family protein phosphatase [Cyanobacteria bacterium P01_F01_bin.33]